MNKYANGRRVGGLLKTERTFNKLKSITSVNRWRRIAANVMGIHYVRLQRKVRIYIHFFASRAII